MVDPKLRLPVLGSVVVALVTLGLKGISCWLTGSVSLLSDAAESLVNLLAAGTALFSLHYSAQPIDKDHTYGHEKIEYFSSGLEGVLILFAAGSIAFYALKRLIWPEPLGALEIGTLLSVTAAVLNFAVAQWLLRVGRSAGSIILEADGQHLMTDVWTSVGVVVSLAIIWLVDKVWQVNISWLDPVIALGLAANISWTAWDLLQRSFDGLMDHAWPESEQAIVRAAIQACITPQMHFHALRTRRAGSRRFLEFHLLVPGSWTVQRAHDLADQIEEIIRAAFPGTEVTVHLEPIEAPTSWADSELIPFEQFPAKKDV